MNCQHSENPEWAVALTSPQGQTGITIYMCHPCLLRLLHSPAVQSNGRTVHVRRCVPVPSATEALQEVFR